MSTHQAIFCLHDLVYEFTIHKETQKCENVVLDVLYEHTHTFGSVSTEITSVLATQIFQLICMDTAFFV